SETPQRPTPNAQRLIPIRIELVRAGHDHDQRTERVQHLDRAPLGSNDLGKATVDVRALVEPAAAQDDALLPDPRLHRLARDSAGADYLPGPAIPPPGRRGPAHDSPGAGDVREERLALHALRLRVVAVARRALHNHGVVAHAPADEALL